MLGKLQPKFFPPVFGPNQNEPLDVAPVKKQFAALAEDIVKISGVALTVESIASGFLKIAVENMANAIKKISVQRGYDVTDYALQCFGGAGGQHACLIADVLGMTTVLIHPFAGVLSAYGMGLADVTALREKSIELALDGAVLDRLQTELDRLAADTQAELRKQDIAADRIETHLFVHCAMKGLIPLCQCRLVLWPKCNLPMMRLPVQIWVFNARQGLVAARYQLNRLVIHFNWKGQISAAPEAPQADDVITAYMADDFVDTPVYQREKIMAGQRVTGPA